MTVWTSFLWNTYIFVIDDHSLLSEFLSTKNLISIRNYFVQALKTTGLKTIFNLIDFQFLFSKFFLLKHDTFSQ